ncbi:hypothetical protein [Deinococcus sp. QL22]|nr:hypothetical protein [Deinococcus sp. QL22]UQN10175.1 hypothetical protein M1R55_28770 [Deinococcus sp. QL22]
MNWDLIGRRAAIAVQSDAHVASVDEVLETLVALRHAQQVGAEAVAYGA